MRPRTALARLRRSSSSWLGLALLACAGSQLPLPPHPDPPLPRPPARVEITLPNPAPSVVASPPPTASAPVPSEPVPSEPAPESAPPPSASASAPLPPLSSALPLPPPLPAHCVGVPPLGPNGAVPPAPPHPPLGEDVEIPGDRPAYVLPGDAGDPRVIVYLPGMCGDATAADYFREAVRAHGTLIAVRGDTPCDNGRFKWRDDPAKIHARILQAFAQVNALRGGELALEHALLFGYSQGADRAEKLAARYPQQYPRVVLGGPPLKPSPRKLSRAKRVVVLGGELETTENMRAGFDALQAAGIASRFFTLECAYHGYFGSSAETQLNEVLDWVSQP